MVHAKRFTGWHMTAILVGFFSIVIIVNLFMARSAIGTFGGTVVDNSYVAGQKFDSWAEDARAQKALGWTVKAGLGEGRILAVAVTDPAGATSGFSATATAEHPLGRAPARPLRFAARPDGRLIADAPLPAGRWHVKLAVQRGRDVVRLIETVQ